MLRSSEINLLPIQSSFQHSLQLQCINSIDKTYMHELEQKITKLEQKLDKKNQLIKYLQRKCGQQIIKTTKKLQQQISKLQSQNSNLKHNGDSSKQYRTHGSQFDKQQSTLCSQFNNGSTNSNLFTEEIVRFGSYWEKLLKFSNQQLREIILMQSTELQRLHNNQENCPTSLRGSFSKDNKKMRASLSKKNNHAPRRNHLKQMSNQNLNQLNVQSSIKDINSSIAINNSQSPLLSSSRKQLKQINFVVSKNVVQTDQKYTQIQPIQYSNIEVQTEETLQTLEQSELQLIDIRIQSSILRKQVQNLMTENNALKQQATYFQQKFKDYYKQYQSNQLILEEPGQKPIQQLPQQEQQQYQPPTATATATTSPYIAQNYRQILQIFGIQPQQPTQDEHTHDKKHQKLLHQICNIKLQITQVLKQYKRLQRQLHQVLIANNSLQTHIKYQDEQMGKIGQYNVQLLGLVGQLNQQVMGLRNREINLRMFGRMAIDDVDVGGNMRRISTKQTQQNQQEQVQANNMKGLTKIIEQQPKYLFPNSQINTDEAQKKQIQVSS